MRKFGLTLAGAAGALVAIAAIQPADAVPVPPNGSFTVSLAGPNTVAGGGSTDINAGSTSLTVSGLESLGSFKDPFLGSADNFCSAAGSGCTAAHPPGFLTSGNPVTQTVSTFPIGPLGVVLTLPGAGDLVTVGPAGGPTVDFTFTKIFLHALTPTAPGAGGSLELDLLGTFTSDSTGTSYTLGQSADMAITCAQPGPGGAITCAKTLDTPAVINPSPEPASLALLGSALVGLGFFRRRRKAA